MNATTDRAAYLTMSPLELERLATNNDAEAQYQLGLRRLNGQGVSQDDKTAFSLWSKAAAQGHALGQNNLGYLYENGRGIQKSDKMAFHWYRKAAEQGNDMGQLNVGKMFAQGRGTKADNAAAKNWYEKSAVQGNAEAEALLQVEEKTVSPKKTLIVFLIVLAIIPWAMFYMTYLAPSINHFLGIDQLQRVKVGYYVLPILVPPALFLWLLFRKDGD